MTFLSRALAATLLIALPVAAVAQEGERARWGAGEVVLGFGRNVASTGPGRAGMVDLEYRDGRDLVRGWRAGIALGLAAEGGGFLAFGLRRDFALGPMTVTFHTGPAFYHPGDGFDEEALLQFRSGLDLALPLGEAGALLAGVYHVSNAGLTEESADLDVARIGLSLKF